MRLVASISTPIATWTNDCWAPAPPVAAFQRTIAVAARRREARGSLEGVDDLDLGAAEMRRLVASIAARDDRVAELVLGQAFAGSAWERVGRTSSRLSEIALLFVFTIGTLPLAIAQRRLRDAFSASMALEWLRRTLSGRVGAFLHRERAFLVGSVLESKMDDKSWQKWLLSAKEKLYSQERTDISNLVAKNVQKFKEKQLNI